MSVTEPGGDCVRDGDCERYPRVGLDWFIDDPVDPTAITVTPAEPETPRTEWLSVPPGATVALEDAR